MIFWRDNGNDSDSDNGNDSDNGHDNGSDNGHDSNNGNDSDNGNDIHAPTSSRKVGSGRITYWHQQNTQR